MKRIDFNQMITYLSVILVFTGFDLHSQSTFKTTIGSGKGESAKLYYLSGNDFLIAGATSFFGNSTGDCFIARVNDSMRVKWVKYIGVTTFNDAVTSAHLMPNGNYRVLGTRVLSTASSDLGSIYLDLNPATGAIVSAARWGNSGTYMSNYLCYSIKTLDGGFLYYGNPEGGLPQGTGQNKMAFVKFNSSMTQQWARYIYHTTSGSPYSNNYEISTAPAAVQLSDSSYIIGGTLAFFGSAALSRPRIVNVAKTGTSTNFISDIYNGYTESIITLQESVNNNGIMVSTSGNSYGHLTKLTLSGNLLWSKQFGTSGGSAIIINNIGRTPDSKYILAGYTSGFGTNADGCLIKADTTGSIIWAKRYTSSGTDDESFNIIIRRGSNYFIGGTFDSSGTTTYYLGNTDAMVLKLDTNGFLCDTFCNFHVYDFTSQVSIVARTPAITHASYTVPTFTYSPVNDNPYGTGNVVLKTDPCCVIDLGTDRAICSNDSVVLNVTKPCASLLWSTSSTSSQIIIKTPGTYWVNVSQAVCEARDTININTDTARVTVNAGNDDTICSNESASFHATANSATAYNWTTGGNGTFSSSSSLTTNYSPGSADISAGYVYLACRATRIYGGCTTSVADTLILSILASPAPPNVYSNGNLCVGDTLMLFADTVLNASYSWNGPGSFTSSLQNPVRLNVGLPDSGNYYCRVHVGSCWSNKDSVKVRIFPVPFPPGLSYTSPVCAGDTLKLAASTVSNALYYWTGPNGFTSIQQRPSKSNIALRDSGYYFCRISVAGCMSDADSVHVVIHNIPSMPSLNSNNPVCEKDTLKLLAGSVLNAVYYWQGPRGFTSSVQNPVRPNILLADSGYYYCRVSVSGCLSGKDSIKAIILTLPALPKLSSNSPLCAGDTLKLKADQVKNAVYFWTGPKGFSSPNQDIIKPNSSPSDSGYYFCRVSVSGCMSKKDSVNTRIFPLPAPPKLTSNSPVCEEDTLRLSSDPVTNAIYLWNGPKGFSSTLRNPVKPNISLTDSGYYSCRVSVSGCMSKRDSVKVRVFQKPSAPKFTSNSPVCEGDTLNLSADYYTGAVYSWKGPHGFTFLLQKIILPAVTLSDSGYYACRISVSICSGKADSMKIKVKPAPPASFAGNNGPICEGFQLNLTASTVPSAGYEWKGPAGFLSSLQNPVVSTAALAGMSGAYYVKSIVNSCKSRADTTIAVVHPKPAKPVITLNGSMLESTNAVIYQWYLNGNIINGATFKLYKPVQNGNYTVVVTDANGCTNESDPYNYNGIGLPHNAKEQSVNLFPNPSGGSITITFPVTVMKITILNSLGQVINEIPVKGQDFITLHLDEAGLYYAVILSSECMIAILYAA